MLKTTLKKTQVGLGLFAQASSCFSPGEVIGVFVGDTWACGAIGSDDWRDKYLLQTTEYTYMSPFDKFHDVPFDQINFLYYPWFVNHSCQPNAMIDLSQSSRPQLLATETIFPGEEITFDYSTTQTKPWQMICLCGNKCRDVIGPSQTLPFSTLLKYTIWGQMPKYAIKNAILNRW